MVLVSNSKISYFFLICRENSFRVFLLCLVSELLLDWQFSLILRLLLSGDYRWVCLLITWFLLFSCSAEKIHFMTLLLFSVHELLLDPLIFSFCDYCLFLIPDGVVFKFKDFFFLLDLQRKCISCFSASLGFWTSAGMTVFHDFYDSCFLGIADGLDC